MQGPSGFGTKTVLTLFDVGAGRAGVHVLQSFSAVLL